MNNAAGVCQPENSDNFSAAPLCFLRQNRILAGRHFARCYNAGKRFFSANFILFVLQSPREDGRNAAPEPATWRLGLAVSKKTGTAVTRNRVKRLAREVFRQNQALLPQGMDIVLVPKKNLDPAKLTYDSLKTELLPVFKSLAKTPRKGAPT